MGKMNVEKFDNDLYIYIFIIILMKIILKWHEIFIK